MTLPQWRVRQPVSAFKIAHVRPVYLSAEPGGYRTLRYYTLVAVNNACLPQQVSPSGYVDKFNPQPGGYFLLTPEGQPAYMSEVDFESRHEPLLRTDEVKTPGIFHHPV